MPITDPSKLALGPCTPTSKVGSSPRTPGSGGKSITTSVPSIAVRFHTGDEELDIYPSTDDEDEGRKNEVLSRSTSATAATFTPPSSNPSPSVQSRDPSPMKEYLKGLGKRSSSVDAGMMDAGSSGSDTWRIFHELKGKITKTVEEKLTEIKSERRSTTPLFSGKTSSKSGRLRAGGNSQDNSSISDSEDISESSNKDDPKILSICDTKLAGTSAAPETATITSTDDKKAVKFGSMNEESPTTSIDNNTIRETPDDTPHIKEKKGRKAGLRYRKGGHVKMSMLHGDDDDSENDSILEEDIESGVEVSEETKFVPGDDDDDVPTIDYRLSPGIKVSSSVFMETRRKSSLEAPTVKSTASDLFTKIWSYRNVSISIIVFILLFILPIPTYMNGMIAGILIAMLYHFIVGMASWYLPYVGPNPPFKIPNYLEKPILEIPRDDNFLAITKCGGWMNELPDTYDPETYNVNNTQTVYVRLEGSSMRLSHPKSKIPKRALWNDRKLKHKFIHQRIYDIAGCEIKLLPEGITRKRRWSKKYPICILLKKEAKKTDCDLQVSAPSSDIDVIVEEQKDACNQLFEDRPTISIPSPSGSMITLTEPSDKDSFQLSLFQNENDSADSSLMSFLVNAAVPETDNKEDKDEEITESREDVIESTFCVIEKPQLEENCLYLFSRTDREKEDWYRRFVVAVKYVPPEGKNEDEEVGGDDSQSLKERRPTDQVGVTVKHTPHHYTFDDSDFNNIDFVAPSALFNADMDYVGFMNKFHLQYNRNKHETKLASALKLDREVDCDVMWANALAGRILYDILQNQIVIEKLSEKIQKKLGTIKLPYFVEELTLTNVELGKDVPMVHRASRPILDDHGLWVDFDMTFEGSMVLTVETKLNLMKLKKEVIPAAIILEPTSEEVPTEENTPEKTPEKCKSPIYDSSVEDSAESSPLDTEEENHQSSSDELNKPTSNTILETVADSPLMERKKASGGRKGVVKMMNKFVSSQFFQNATENKYIKRAMEGVSNTRIVLTVEIKACTGQLAVNIPPPPSDRLWYGFRGNPHLWISVKPKFGQRQVNISYITSWLEKKLILEFQKKVVLPNMDDLVISPMRTLLPE